MIAAPATLPAPAPAVLPRRLCDYRNLHAGETIIVCGCGRSLAELPAPERRLTIGVNDVGRLFDPTYLVVVNPKSQFRGDRFRHVAASRAGALFTQRDPGRDLGITHPCIVRFRLGRRGGTDLDDPDTLPYTRNSPYVAVCLAAFLGARRIGLIGVDFTDHHFFASTGAHPLSRELAQIDREYGHLAAALARRGVELVNLSRESRLAALPKVAPAEFLKEEGSARTEERPARAIKAATTEDLGEAPRVFFVHYQFLSCGDVFTRGLEHAARDLGLAWAGAAWDDPRLPERVERFRPDLLFVVHGRRFRQRWGDRFRGVRSAVWLLDEPYEVDDTERTSQGFDAVFVNDPSTLGRHRNAHYLPAAWDPHRHAAGPDEERRYAVGFIGGGNPAREEMLVGLAREGLLSYVVGGPWRARELRALSLGANVPPDRTAALYRQTKLVVNVFRDRHHYNRRRLPATSLNPRVYEALACGALVVSEEQPELAEVFPELPRFTTPAELTARVRELLGGGARAAAVLARCRERLAGHSYTDRLRSVLGVCLPPRADRATEAKGKEMKMEEPATRIDFKRARSRPAPTGARQSRAKGTPRPPQGWVACGAAIVRAVAGDELELAKRLDLSPASEEGLASEQRYAGVALACEARLSADAWFVAKVHQREPHDQATNSYHLMAQPGNGYLARHHLIFTPVEIPRERWVDLILRREGDSLELTIDGTVTASLSDRRLRGGHAFLGLKGGRVWLRRLRLTDLGGSLPDLGEPLAGSEPPPHRVLRRAAQPGAPKVSIVTTVYDRTACLARAIRSVQQLLFHDYEHLIIADAPPPEVLARIQEVVTEAGDPRLTLATLLHRANDWGSTPAAAGLHLARGEYLCFLSDDNAYTPDHLDSLVMTLDREPAIGFAYSSCLYDGRLILRSPPLPARIDLGQPLFRRALFERYLGGTIPSHVMAWDWEMIHALLRAGVRWRHVDRVTFLFRLVGPAGQGKAA